MSLTENLEKYADLIVNVGLNLKAGDKLTIRLSEDALPLARLVSRKAYEKGVLNVRYDLNDDQFTLDRFLYGSEAVFDTYPDYEVDFRESLFLDNYHLLALDSPDPELLKSVDPKRIAKWQKLAGTKTKRVSKYTMQNIAKWCVAGVASKAWAKAVFPDLPIEEAIEKLWQNIFMAERVDQADPVEAWKAHDENLKAHRQFLNDARFVKLHYQAPGTDLMVGLPEGHSWEGGSSLSKAGDRFFPNLPTEEIFSMPDADHVDGTLAATMPLALRGQIVDKFGFTFKDGKVVDHYAEIGKQILDDLLETDEGARRLGEVALVPASSPIAKTGLLFKKTLFDENASCHFALGQAYSENLDGADERSDEENRKLGMNTSVVHVDFMVGSKELNVTGIKADGSEVAILRNGEWAI